ncbi:ATP-binding protein [Planctomicrobium sp. SH527]|uniref:Dph6-related ATP pyrophosphatase n=1 Tax=Planctomicrobium sp. SH527 TaxID=3448123 RepID=UPI003F5B8B1E
MKPNSKVLLSWSSGKDCAWTLHQLRQRPDIEVVGLLTTINEQNQRVAMHGVSADLVRQQAQAAGLPLWLIPLPWPCSNADYELRMQTCWERAVQQGISGVAFGDLFLEEVRAYREKQLSATGLTPHFPIWQTTRETASLAREIISAGFRTRITCVDSKQLDPAFVGREFNDELLAELPSSVDPCGENGEFHTFCYNGAIYSNTISITNGEKVDRDGFHFIDLLSAPDSRC